MNEIINDDLSLAADISEWQNKHLKVWNEVRLAVFKELGAKDEGEVLAYAERYSPLISDMKDATLRDLIEQGRVSDCVEAIVARVGRSELKQEPL
ncbi:MAG: hypothetical protein HY974_04250 [Candidatus Kerfeldbacteria bacterium]|nr:hypothetical protein [Candidatus Kerfeldbacteria bacterium]